MSDEIVTRLRGYDFMRDGDTPDLTMAEAADEIERLRTLLDNTLERENKDNARQLQIVRKVEADRDRWRNICDYWYKASCSHNWRQDQSARRKYEQAVSGE